MHPSRMIVATGDASNTPSVHIWNIITLEPYKVLKTNHQNGILHISFSNDGDFLVTVGFEQFFSIEVRNWHTEEVIAFRNTDELPILDVKFNSYDKYEFVSCGYRNICCWKIEGRSLVRKEWIHVRETQRENDPIFTCTAYLDYIVGKQVQSDVIVGNNFGDIGLVTNGKYHVIK